MIPIPLSWSGPFRRRERRRSAVAPTVPVRTKPAIDTIRDWLETPLPHEVRSPWAKWIGAMLITAFAIGFRQLIDPFVHDQLPLSTLYGAVAVVVWFAGFWPAVITGAAGFLICDYLFIGPRYEFTWSFKDANDALLFGFGAGVTIVIGVRMRSAQARARENGRLALERQRTAERAFDALRESEEQFRALAENLPQLVWMNGPGGDVFWYNRRWLDYTGVPLEQARGWGWQQVMHPDHLHRVTESFGRAIAAGILWEETFPLRDAHGQYRWFLGRAFPIRDAAGRITRWFGTSTDITVLRDTQEALRAAQRQVRDYAAGLEKTVAERTARLQETVHELEAFSYSIAHDMRAPLRSMIGYAEILREEHAPGLDAPGREYLGRISVSARRLDGLIQDVLNYSRIVREELPLDRVDTRALVLEVLDSYPNLTAVKPHVFVAELPVVIGNRAALTQVLSNLLGNAVKFVPAGVVPAVRVYAEPALAPHAVAAGEWVRVTVADNGIGIDPTVIPRLFAMFQRFTRPGLYEGTAMGLAIARKAVDRMGGVIGVESTVGQGSRFWFVLPRAPSGDQPGKAR